jgi:hypothetical protein
MLGRLSLLLVIGALGCAGGANTDTTPAQGTAGAADAATSSSSGATDTGGSSSSGAADTGGGTEDTGSSTSSSSGATDAGSGATDAGSSTSSSGGGADTGSSKDTGTSTSSSSGGTDASSTGQDTTSSSSGSDTSTTGGDATTGCAAGQFTDPTTGTCMTADCATMSKTLHGAIDALVAASNSCNEDTECQVAQTATACQGTCGAAINKQHLTLFGGKLKNIEAKVCTATGYAQKCGFSTPKCLAPNAGCVAGKCVYSKPKDSGCSGPQPKNTVCKDKKWVCKDQYFAPYGSTDCVEATCSNKSKYKNEAVNAAVKSALLCNKDDECVMVATGTACNGTCGAAVNKGMANDVKKVVGWVNDHICKLKGPGSPCPYFSPSCLQPKPGCKDGACVGHKKNTP